MLTTALTLKLRVKVKNIRVPMYVIGRVTVQVSLYRYRPNVCQSVLVLCGPDSNKSTIVQLVLLSVTRSTHLCLLGARWSLMPWNYHLRITIMLRKVGVACNFLSHTKIILPKVSACSFNAFLSENIDLVLVFLANVSSSNWTWYILGPGLWHGIYTIMYFLSINFCNTI